MKRFFSLTVLILTLNFSFADDVQISAETETLSHTQVALTAFIPYGVTLTGIGCRYAFADYLRGPVMTGFSAAANIPSCIIDPYYSIPMTFAGTAMMTCQDIGIKRFEEYSIGHKNLKSTGHFGFDMNMYTAYHGYAEARKKGPEELYGDKKSYSFTELMLSPFDPDVLKEKYVLTAIFAYSSVLFISNSMDGFENSVFKSGKGYFGNKKVNALAGFAGLLAYSLVDYTVTGVGEEALFRGTGYEEMKVSFGVIPAKITDAVCFSGAHIPQDIFIEKYDSGEVTSGFVSRAVMGLMLQAIYDKCGLKGSTAVHMWIDTAITMFQYLYQCGVENDYTFSLKFKINL